ncbi:hypothetical protein BH20ACT9_BH20ACT9_22210 [soil metagenome]
MRRTVTALLAVVMLLGLAGPAGATVYPNRPQGNACVGAQVEYGVRWDGKPSAAYAVRVYSPPDSYGNRNLLAYQRGYNKYDWGRRRVKTWRWYPSRQGYYITEISKFSRVERRWVKRVYWTYSYYC